MKTIIANDLLKFSFISIVLALLRLSIIKIVPEKENERIGKMAHDRLIKLKGHVQNYSWGKVGKSSEVALLYGAGGSIIDEKKPYAELWMGTHSKGPSLVTSTGQTLSKYLAGNPAALGKGYPVSNAEDFQLPFLFKVLSVNEALSIQSHPNKEQAKVLHAKDPKNYPDDNHKPEMAIALTEFEMLSGFRPSSEIINYINELPELRHLIKSESFELFQKSANKEGLKMCFSDIMNQAQVGIEKSLKALADKFSSFGDDQTKGLFLRIYKAFPNDVGCLAVFFLNYIVLQPGEAVFLGPNEPHAYLLGDCVECMACSDNTIRAGLTPKFKDVDNLVAMLTYSMNAPDRVKFKPKKLSNTVVEYTPPVPEFVVHKVEINQESTVSLPKLHVFSIIICIRGRAQVANTSLTIAEGDIYFVPADIDLQLHTSTGHFLLFRAFCSEPGKVI